MVSTLTLSTVSSVAGGGIAGALGVVCFLFLLGFLFQKELASVIGGRFQKLAGTLNIAIVPLLMAFILVVVSRVIEDIP